MLQAVKLMQFFASLVALEAFDFPLPKLQLHL